MKEKELQLISKLTIDKERELNMDYIARTRAYIERIDKELKNVSEEIRLTVYFAILDGLAQGYNNYPSKNSGEVFERFVLNFQDKYDFLEDVDPVTLYYDTLNITNGNIDLEDIKTLDILCPSDNNLILKEKELVAYINKVAKYPDIIIKKHKYIRLIYRLRNKIMHEFSMANALNLFDRGNLPYYHTSSSIFTRDKNSDFDVVVERDAIELKIPVDFIRNLCLNCANNYLNYCEKENLNPFPYNNFERKSEYSWY